MRQSAQLGLWTFDRHSDSCLGVPRTPVSNGSFRENSIRKSVATPTNSEDKALIRDAVRNLIGIFRDFATSEALMRAVVAERTNDQQGADFWIRVYFECRARLAGDPATSTGRS